MESNPSVSVTTSPLIDVETVAQSVSIPFPVLQGIWQKAEELIDAPNSITSAPGHSTEARMVLSRSGKRPHLVVPDGKGGQYKCDAECLNYKSVGMCSHVIAVAHLNDGLQKFLDWFKKVKKRPNTSQH